VQDATHSDLRGHILAGGPEPPSPAAQDGGLVSKGITHEHHCQQLLFVYFSICIFTLSSSFLGSMCQSAPTARHQAPGNCTPRGALITNATHTSSHSPCKPVSKHRLCIPEHHWSRKVGVAPKGRQNASAGYQAKFFSPILNRRQLWCSPHGQESSAEQLPWHGKSVSACRGEGREGLRRKCV